MDPTAEYLLRTARALARRGGKVTVFLTDHALAASPRAVADRLRRLSAPHLNVVADAAILRRRKVDAARLGVAEACEADLSRWLLTPGLNAYWC